MSCLFGRCARTGIAVMLLLIPAWTSGQSLHESTFDRGEGGRVQRFRGLRSTATVLHIIAHPDDEDAGTLAWAARVQGARTIVLSLTRGEGGANLISPLFFDELGVLRSLEFAAACREYGVELHFTRAVDYGYSKQLSEALDAWPEDVLLSDVVRAVRMFRPDVVLSRFRGDPRDGHGHHQLAGRLARKAVVAAADPGVFPEHASEGLSAWRVPKLYHDNIRPRWRDEDRDAWTVAIDVGDLDPAIGLSPAQIGRSGYGLHRSQGMLARLSDPGRDVHYYRRVDGVEEAPGSASVEIGREASIFEGLDVSLPGLASSLAPDSDDDAVRQLRDRLSVVAALIDSADGAFARGERVAGVLALLDASRRVAEISRELESERSVLKSSDRVRDRLRVKSRQLESTLVAAIGLTVDAEIAAGGSGRGERGPVDRVVPGQSFLVDARVNVALLGGARLSSLTLEAPSSWSVSPVGDPARGEVARNEPLSVQFSVVVSTESPPTRLRWRRESVAETLYTLLEVPGESGGRRESGAVGMVEPLPDAPLSAVAELEVFGAKIPLRVPVAGTLRSLERGESRVPVAVLPSWGVSFSRSHSVVTAPSRGDRRAIALDVIVESHAAGSTSGEVSLGLPEAWTSHPEAHSLTMSRAGEKRRIHFEVSPEDGLEIGDEVVIVVRARVGGRLLTDRVVEIGARDIGRAFLVEPARHTVRIADVRLAEGLRVGYIDGSGDEVAESLRSLGVDADTIGAEDLARGDLARYSTIVVGVRAYAVREDVVAHNARLLEFVERGGTLIVQYQTPDFDREFGPFPYSMGRAEEVSEERAAVTILAPLHECMTRPNAISSRDFEGWIEQRGSKWWESWDERYVAILESRDREQEPQRGGLLCARYGKGHYVYAAYSFYRQLPAGVPGAFRLFANLLSLGRS